MRDQHEHEFVVQHTHSVRFGDIAGCDEAEVCSKTDEDNWTCKPKAAIETKDTLAKVEKTCLEHGYTCSSASDKCCPEKSTPYSCVPWGDNHMECREKVMPCL